jgi:molybdate transport system regulatory protein
MSIIPPMKLKAQLMCGDEAAIGPGKAMVLESIERTGGISAAGRELGMSYRRIWLLVDSMNRCWVEKLVATSPGGRQGGGARLTAFGKRVLTSFRALERRMEIAAQQDDYAELIKGLRDEPLPATAPSHPLAQER